MSAVVTPAPVPVWEDFLEIFYAPRAVFERRKNAGFGVPLIVLCLAFAGMFYAGRGLLQPMFDAEFDRGFAMAMKQNPQLTADKAEQGRAVARAFTGIIIPVFGLIVPMVAGVMLWLLGKAVGARQELGAACMVAVYAFFPRLAEGLLNLLQAAVLPAENLTSHFAIQLGPARFLDPDGSSLVLITLLGRLDLITIWCTALLALGLSVTGKISLNKAAIAAGGVWLLGTLLQLIGPLRAATQ